MKFAWKALVLLGVAIVLMAFSLDTTVSTGGGQRVHNIGLQAQQQMLLILGCAVFLAGMVVFGIAKLKQTPEDDARELAQERELKASLAKGAENAASLSKQIAEERVAFVGSMKERLGRIRTRHVLLLGLGLIVMSVLFPPRLSTTYEDGGIQVVRTVRPLIGTSRYPLLPTHLIVQLLLCTLGTGMALRLIGKPSTASAEGPDQRKGMDNRVGRLSAGILVGLALFVSGGLYSESSVWGGLLFCSAVTYSTWRRYPSRVVIRDLMVVNALGVSVLCGAALASKHDTLAEFLANTPLIYATVLFAVLPVLASLLVLLFFKHRPIT